MRDVSICPLTIAIRENLYETGVMDTILDHPSVEVGALICEKPSGEVYIDKPSSGSQDEIRYAYCTVGHAIGGIHSHVPEDMLPSYMVPDFSATDLKTAIEEQEQFACTVRLDEGTLVCAKIDRQRWPILYLTELIEEEVYGRGYRGGATPNRVLLYRRDRLINQLESRIPKCKVPLGEEK